MQFTVVIQNIYTRKTKTKPIMATNEWEARKEVARCFPNYTLISIRLSSHNR